MANTNSLPSAYLPVKRAADVVVSLAALMALWPVMVLVAAAVKLDSRGPALFCQERVGKDDRLFVLYKFRTMRIGTPIVPTDQMKLSPVSYYTSVGRLLRRFSLDELPQLWNVLCGEMSMIGPRPSLPGQEWLNGERSARHVTDLCPGITGLAQVLGRDQLTDGEKLEYDTQYRHRLSLWLDCWIVVRTIRAVITGVGAN